MASDARDLKAMYRASKAAEMAAIRDATLNEIRSQAAPAQTK